MYSSDELFQRSREVYFGNKHQNNTRVGAETVRYESTSYIISSLTRHNEAVNDDKNNDLCVPHTLGFRSADDVTIDCWWRHNKQTIVTRSRA